MRLRRCPARHQRGSWRPRFCRDGPVVWLEVFASYNLYDNDSLKISVSSFDELDLFHVMLVGSLGYLILSQGVDFFFDWCGGGHTAVEAFLLMAFCARVRSDSCGSDRSWVPMRCTRSAPAAMTGRLVQSQDLRSSRVWT